VNALRLLKTSTFQLAAVYIGLFAVSVLVMLAFVYWSTIGFMSSQTDSTIEAEIQGLAETYRRGGLPGLTQLISERIQNDPDRRSLYLFASPDYRPLGGNLPNWPGTITKEDEWVNFVFESELGAKPARGRVFGFAGGLQLLVARDVSELQATENLLLKAYFWGMVLALGLALLGGFLMSASVTRRIEAINQTSREIVTGRLHQRMPVRGTGDEFDHLATNLNAMLDKIDLLIESVRHVADGVAHDLRTPLTRLRSRLESLSLAPGLESGTRSELESCIEEADGLLNTFSALLRIARIESGRHEGNFVQLDLRELAGDACELYQATAEELGIDLRCQTQPAMVLADRNLLFQALINLVDNALKHAGKGEVTVVVRREPDASVLEVWDQGEGIAEKDRQRVTGRFYRGANAAKVPGSGLGLSLVQAVADMHQAELRLEDAEPGLRVVLRFKPAHPEHVDKA